MTKNLFERAVALNRKEFIYSVCMKLIRKEFLIRENLEFLNISGEDAVLTWCVVCAAERYVLIPNATYVYRIHDESFTHNSDNFDLEKRIKKLIKSITIGFDYLDKFLLQKDFFAENSQARYLVLDALIENFTAYFISIYAKNPAWEVNEIILRELSAVKNKTALAAFLFGRMNTFNVNLKEQQQIISQQQETITELEQQLQNISRKF